MRLLALLAVSNALLGASASPAAKRQDESSSLTSSTSSTTSSTSSSSTEAPTRALQATTLNDGSTTTVEVDLSEPTKSGDATTTSDADTEPSATMSGSPTGETAPASTGFPTCEDDNAAPFCLPMNNSILYVGKDYIVTWNTKFASKQNFKPNSTIEIKLQWANDTETIAWTSGPIMNGLGHTTVNMEEGWLQSYNIYNLTFRAFIYDGGNTQEPAVYDGPTFTLEHEPPRHYPPPPKNKLEKTGLYIGLPLGLAFVALVVVGLFIGMRKNRIIGIGNVMGRRGKGYGVGKSRRQRLGLGGKGAIRLEDRAAPQYSDEPGRPRGDSLGSLVSDDDTRPAPGTNHFRDEINRQRTGR